MSIFIYLKNTSFFLLTFVFFNISVFGQSEEKELYEGKFAPPFSVKDIDGKFHSVEKYKGQKILLSFYRNASDPISNYRLHELEAEKEYFKSKNIVLIAVYESSLQNLRLLRDTNSFYQLLVADSEGILYEEYGVDEGKERSTKGKLNGVGKKVKEGKKLLSTKIIKDKKSKRTGADFLIDENGNIMFAYYSKYHGDSMPISLIKEKLN